MKKYSAAERMLAISLLFTMCLLLVRIVYSGTLSYIFFAWNLFLAAVPLLFSRKLQQQEKLSRRAVVLITGWLLFLPNAPYVLTDIFHFRERLPIPKWYDLLLVSSAAWNGLFLGFTSIMQAEAFFSRHISPGKRHILITATMLLCGYGVYIGRYLRFNSWDILSSPLDLAEELYVHFRAPISHYHVWLFTVLFAAMLMIAYYMIKTMAQPQQK